MVEMKKMAKYVIKVDDEQLKTIRDVPFHHKHRFDPVANQKFREFGQKHLSASWGSYDPGGSLDLHVHDDFDQIFFPIAGRARFELDGEKFDVSPNMIIFVPRGVTHGAEVLGDETYKHYSIVSPPPQKYQPRAPK